MLNLGHFHEMGPFYLKYAKMGPMEEKVQIHCVLLGSRGGLGATFREKAGIS